MVHLAVRLATDAPELVVQLAAGDSIAFGRGGGAPVDLVLEHPGLSRRAGMIGLFRDGRVSVTSFQTGGLLEVRRSNGITANRLAKGEACVVAPGSYALELVGLVGPPLLIELRADVEPPVGRDGGVDGGSAARAPAEPDRDATARAVSARDVLRPAPGREWQTVLALACVLARRSPRSDGWAAPSSKQLAAAVGAWFGIVVSDKWLSDRLDAALDHLHLPRDGTDKLPRLVARSLAGDLLPDRLLDEVEQRLVAARNGAVGGGQ